MAQKRGENCRFPGTEKSAESCHVAGCHGFFQPWFPEISGDLVEFGRNSEISGELSGIQWVFVWRLVLNSVELHGGFRANAGLSGKIWGWGGFGRFGASKGCCANSNLDPVCSVCAALCYNNCAARPVFEQLIPKGPCRTKNTTHGKFTTRSESTIALWFTIAAHLVRTPSLQTFFPLEEGSAA